MKKTRCYIRINTKDLTVTEHHLSFDAFGKVYCNYSFDIVPYGECKHYVRPFMFFILAVNERVLKKEYYELYEILENKTYDYMVKEFENLF